MDLIVRRLAGVPLQPYAIFLACHGRDAQGMAGRELGGAWPRVRGPQSTCCCRGGARPSSIVPSASPDSLRAHRCRSARA